MKTLCALLAVSLFSSLAAAQRPLLPSADKMYEDWYDVELIVFAQNRSNHGVPAPGLVDPLTANAIELEQLFETQSHAIAVAQSGLAPPPESGFMPLPKDNQQLNDLYLQLDNTGGYRPISYFAWRQKATRYSDAQAVHIQGGEIFGTRQAGIFERETEDNMQNSPWPRAVPITEIDGTAKLSLANQPQLLLDLVFRTRDQFNPLRTSSQTYRAQGDQGFNTWHLREHRSMEPGELQYFDHRRFGVIVLVHPYQPAPTPTSALPLSTGNASSP